MVNVTCYPLPDGNFMRSEAKAKLCERLEVGVAGSFTCEDAPLRPADVRVFFRDGSPSDSPSVRTDGSHYRTPISLFIDIEMSHTPVRHADKEASSKLLRRHIKGHLGDIPFDLWVKLNNAVYLESTGEEKAAGSVLDGIDEEIERERVRTGM